MFKFTANFVRVSICNILVFILAAGQVFGQASANSGIADRLFVDRYFDKALRLYEKESFKSRDSTAKALLLNKIAYCNLKSRKYETADTLLRLSLQLSGGKGWAAIEAWMFSGELQYETFNHAKALVFFEKASAALVNTKKDIKSLCRVYWSIGMTYSRGFYDYDRAQIFLNRAIALSELTRDPYLTGMIHYEQAIVFNGESEKDQAMLHLLKATKYFDQIENNSMERAEVENLMGNITIESDSNAIAHYRAAVTIGGALKTSTSDYNIGKYTCNQGVYFWIHGKPEIAKQKYWRAIQQYTRLPNHGYGLSLACLDLGELYTQQHNFDSADHYLNKCLLLRKSLFGQTHPEVSAVYLHLGELSLERKEINKALDNFKLALLTEFATEEGSSRQTPKYFPPANYLTYFYILSDRARAYRAAFKETKDPENLNKALDDVNTLDSLVEVVRGSSHWESSRIFVSSNFRYAYELAVDCLFELYKLDGNKAHAKKAFALMDRIKYQALNEKLRRRLYEGNSDDHEASEESIKERLTEIKAQLSFGSSETLQYEYLEQLEAYDSIVRIRRQASVPGDESLHNSSIDPVEYAEKNGCTILSLLNTPESVYRLAIHKSEISFIKIEKTNTFLEQLEYVSATCSSPPNINSNALDAKTFASASYSLYKALIGLPVAELTSSSRLIVIPDNATKILPLEALTVEADSGKSFQHLPYLIRYVPVSYQFSWLVFANQIDVDRRPVKSLTVFTSSPREYALFQEKSGELGDDFELTLHGPDQSSKQAFTEKSGVFDVIHLGIHGQGIVNNPGSSGIFFPVGKDSILYEYQVYKLKLNTRLITLSACETGVGTSVGGEGVYSMAHGFYYAGCPSLLIGLWKIEDWSAASFALKFYSFATKDNLYLDEALQAAKKDFALTRDEVLAHPYYWSGLVLTGDPSPLRQSEMLYYLAFLLLMLILGVALWLKVNRNNYKPQ